MRSSSPTSRLWLACFVSYALLASASLPLPLAKAVGGAESRPTSVEAKKAAGHLAPARGDAPRREGELLVRFREGVSEQERGALAAARGARRKKALRGESRVEKLELEQGRDAAAAADELRLRPEVEFVEPNYLIRRAQVAPNDARFAEQWALRNTGQSGGTPGTDVGAAQAWHATTGATETIVAVVDSGVDFTHTDLAGNRWANARERDNQRDDDDNGYLNDLHGWDFVTDTGAVRDPHGHGTAAAGIIAAQGNNGAGMAGVMWRAGLMSLRVLDAAGTGDVADAVEAIDYAARMGASVINCSWGTEAESLALRDAIERAGRRGVVVVASAGNGGQDIDAAPSYPAAFDLPNLVAVAASDSFDNLAPFSNRGAVRVAVAAPGVDILTTKMGGGHWLVSGTSAAAPHVSGVAGLLKTNSPWLGAAGVKRAIIDGARRADTLAGKVSSGGVVNAPGALREAQGAGIPAPGNGNGNGHGDGNEHGNGAGQTPRPDASTRNRGQGVRRVAPPSSNESGGQGVPDLDALRSQPSYMPTEPPAHIRSNLAPICADCFEPTGTTDPQFSTARDLPRNETGEPGEDLGSKNFNWSAPLVRLPGRAGHDLGLTLFYNSLVWTKQGTSIQYNADGGSPAPGFQFGFPVLQKQFFDAETSSNAYMMVTPSGGRVKLVQTGAGSNFYESIDGSYAQLDKAANVVRTADGTQYVFGLAVGTGAAQERRCTTIRDRNGNFISITYHSDGRIQNVTDTLLRTVNFVYDGDGNLSQLTQARGASGHTDLLAQFDYGTQLVQPAFSGLTVFGPVNQYISVLTKVTLPDGSSYGFDWTYYGQVTRFRRQAPDGHVLSYTRYNLPGSEFFPSMPPLADCPRFTERMDYIQNGVRQQDASIYTTYQTAADDSWTLVVQPDDTPADPNDNIVEKHFFETTGWRKGLPNRTEVFRAGTPSTLLKWTTTAWTQDNESLAYQKNPRPVETNVYDAEGNRRRTTIDYTEGYSLPTHVREWGGPNGDQFLRMTATSYQLASGYVDRRIIGLPYQRLVFDGPTGSIVSKVVFQYDFGGDFRQFQGAATQHEPSFDANHPWRGNASSVARFDANYPDDWSRIHETRTGYNTNGSAIFNQDASGHTTHFNYADNYSDGNNSRGTFAYPTQTTDPEGYVSTARYNYATGAVMEARRASSGTNGQGNVTYETHVMLYDWAARLQKVTNQNSGLYTRYEYPSVGFAVQSFSNLKPGAAESYSVEVYDGAGRVRASAGYMPERTDYFSGVKIDYDPRGLIVRQSKPTEMTGGWEPTGPDAGDWRYTAQAYDWQGRPTETTRLDGYTSSLTYGGCGCAGGETVTARDEAGRRRKLYKDTLGRLVKVEELDWVETVYSTALYAYNARDQLTSIRHYQGAATSGVYQQRTLEYDGYGRLWKRTTPEQGMVEYAYNPDDTVAWTRDARSAKTNFAYSARHLVTAATFEVPGGVAATPNLTFDYDAAANRTLMTDGLGSVAYTYDSQSRLTQESRNLNGVGVFNLTYGYDNAGLASVTNPWGSQVAYAKDHTGTVTAVTGAGPVSAPTYAQGLQYRAFGSLKQMTYGNARQLSVSYDVRMRPTEWNVAGIIGSEYRYDDFHEHTGRATYARDLYNSARDRSYEYDHVGRLRAAHTGINARAHADLPGGNWNVSDGPYAHDYFHDVWGNITQRVGWGGWNASVSYTYANNRISNPGHTYDAAGNLTNDGASYAYDATGQQTSAVHALWNVGSGYDGDRLRVRKTENGLTTYYLRSSVLGGQVVAEVNASGVWQRGHVYLGGQLLAVQAGGAVHWQHEDPVTKSKALTDATGALTSLTVVDPWGGEASAGWQQNAAQQRRKYTSYERDAHLRDEAMMRQYSGWYARFTQPDPSDASYDLTDPQSDEPPQDDRTDCERFADEVARISRDHLLLWRLTAGGVRGFSNRGSKARRPPRPGGSCSRGCGRRA